jgi:CubicO group peptidase (beta-lactamase class C family)
LPKPAKSEFTVRQLLAHQAGLFAFDEPVDREVVADRRSTVSTTSARVLPLSSRSGS